MVRLVSALAAEWIEIAGITAVGIYLDVSALAAEWIEIICISPNCQCSKVSPPSRRSGLKLTVANVALGIYSLRPRGGVD